MAEQLTMDLPVLTAHDRDDFFVSDANRNAVARIEAWSTWPLGKLALLGPSGSGKTHLAHVWADLTGGQVKHVSEITKVDLGALSAPLAIEGLGTPLNDADEVHLFHLHNALAAAKLPLLLTAETGPARWPIRLPDLASRFSAADIATIDAPDDQLLMVVLVKQFADRQLRVSPEVVQWLSTRLDRSFAAAKSAVERLDAAALEGQKTISRSFAAKTLGLGSTPATP